MVAGEVIVMNDACVLIVKSASEMSDVVFPAASRATTLILALLVAVVGDGQEQLRAVPATFVHAAIGVNVAPLSSETKRSNAAGPPPTPPLAVHWMTYADPPNTLSPPLGFVIAATSFGATSSDTLFMACV